MNETSILLWGGGKQARLIESMLLARFSHTSIVIYDSSRNSQPPNLKSTLITDLKSLKSTLPKLKYFIVCIGNEFGYARFEISMRLMKIGLEPLNIIHEKSFLDSDTSIGFGLQAMPMATVHKFTNIGNFCILNTNSAVDHECTIGNGVHVMGSAAISGGVSIGDFSTIGTNATILPNITIGDNCFIGAGAVVTKNIGSDIVVVGNPAKFLRKNPRILFDHPLP